LDKEGEEEVRKGKGRGGEENNGGVKEEEERKS